MSQQSRPFMGGMQNYIPGQVMPNVRGNVTPFTYAQQPGMAVNMAAGAPQQFIPTPVVYPGQIGETGMQHFYVPVQQMPVRSFHNVATVQKVPADPAKSVEDQRKFEKERNFQLQQQRLKQFTVAGKKGALNADYLFDSMFGKHEVKKNAGKSQKLHKMDQNPVEFPTTNAFVNANSATTSRRVPVSTDNLPTYPYPRSTIVIKDKVPRDPKELENMMLKCSNFSGPQKAKSFQKPTVKELPKLSPQGTVYSPSEKSIDWKNIQGLDNVFMVPRQRFPTWCKRDTVPPIYLHIENMVTNDGTGPLDTGLLYPILLSSGLPQKTLGVIWSMVNQTSQGTLIPEEMYSALALIAVVQAGHPLKSADVLHQLSSCPVPHLQCFSPTQPPVSDASPPEGPKPDRSEEMSSSSSPNVRPSSLPPFTEPISVVTNSVSNWSPFADKGPDSADDEFDDFKSATPMAVNAPPLTELACVACDDEFDDFKQAPTDSTSTFPSSYIKSIDSKTVPFPATLTSISTKKVEANRDLMLPVDKYSAFRTFQDISDSSETQSLTGSSVAGTTKKTMSSGLFGGNDAEESLLLEDQPSPKSFATAADKTDSDEDDFGDFLDARATPVSSPKISSECSQQQEIIQQPNESASFHADFADFSQLDNGASVSVKLDNSTVDNNVDAEFGAFAAFQKSTFLKPESGYDYFFNMNHDNISLAESQSISSLELGTFDGAGHSGGSKSSLSRQGSIPSLDLKVQGSETADGDEEFGVMQSAEISSASSSTVHSNRSSNERIQTLASVMPVQLPQNSTVVDKYSVIRSEQIFDENQHIIDWLRCIKSSLKILHDATRLFNQMSCSTVCNEVLSIEEGRNYVKNVIEVYRVVCRISLASKSYKKQNDRLTQLINDANHAYNTLTVFLTGSSLLPCDAFLDFSPGILVSESTNNERACGVCLLNVDSQSKANRTEDLTKLTYGGRQYHCTCANLWVNCVDPLLPTLTLPQLI